MTKTRRLRALIAEWRERDTRNNTAADEHYRNANPEAFVGASARSIVYRTCADELSALLSEPQAAQEIEHGRFENSGTASRAGRSGADKGSPRHADHVDGAVRQQPNQDGRGVEADEATRTDTAVAPRYFRDSAMRLNRATCSHQYWDLGYCIDCGIHSNDPQYAQQLRARVASAPPVLPAPPEGEQP